MPFVKLQHLGLNSRLQSLAPMSRRSPETLELSTVAVGVWSLACPMFIQDVKEDSLSGLVFLALSQQVMSL